MPFANIVAAGIPPDRLLKIGKGHALPTHGSLGSGRKSTFVRVNFIYNDRFRRKSEETHKPMAYLENRHQNLVHGANPPGGEKRAFARKEPFTGGHRAVVLLCINIRRQKLHVVE